MLCINFVKKTVQDKMSSCKYHAIMQVVNYSEAVHLALVHKPLSICTLLRIFFPFSSLCYEINGNLHTQDLAMLSSTSRVLI